MKTHMFKKIGMTILLLMGLGGVTFAQGQTNYQASNTQTTVKGTSTLHDWEMTSARGQTKAAFTIVDNQVTGITALSFTLAAESLKSDRSGLDKNAYKALDTDQYKNITFTLISGTVTSSGGNNFKVSATGNLQVAGTTKRATITADGQYHPADKSITIQGGTQINMSTYGVTPPVLMMGTIKTGDPITIIYRVKLTSH